MSRVNHSYLKAEVTPPTLDVIIPNHNQGHLLEIAVEAICHQSIRPNQIIIVDDASTDSSKEIIQKLQNKYMFINAFFLAENVGSVRASKIGFENSFSDYVQFASSKDLIAQDSYKKMITALEMNPDAAFVSGIVRITFNGKKLGVLKPSVLPVFRSRYLSGEQVKKHLRRSDNWMMTVGAIFRRTSISALGFPDERLGALADGYFARKLGAIYGFVFIPDIVYTWNQMSNSQSKVMNQTSGETLQILGLIYREMLNSEIFFKDYAIKFIDRSIFSILLDRMVRKIPLNDLSFLDFYGTKNKSKIWIKLLQLTSTKTLPKFLVLMSLFILLKPVKFLDLVLSLAFRLFVSQKFRINSWSKNRGI